MAIPESELRSWLHSEIFNHIPMNIAVIDRDYNVVDVNSNFEKYFSDWQNQKCHKVYKGCDTPCASCEALKTFDDHKARVHQEYGRDSRGKPTRYTVHTAPVTAPDGHVSFIIKMSQDITDIHNQQAEYKILFERVPCYIGILDSDFRIVRANEKLRETFGEFQGKRCYEVYKRRDGVCEDCPAALSFKDGLEHYSTQVGISMDGKETHYIVTTTPLMNGKEGSSYVMEILTDITEIKALEKEMLEAERLSAVGQTVAGLSHTVKNILLGVEGGMYMVDTGLKKDDKDRISEGWEMLGRNISKVSQLVKDFLSFAKGRKPNARLLDPNDLVDEIIQLYSESAKNIGVNLECSSRTELAPAPLDPDGIHTCLTNLVSNAIDACRISSNPNPCVTIRVFNRKNVLVFEVGDNGSGMDYEIRKKVFSTFFTTKGGEGTGLGLLTTRKIVQEHGGKIFVESEPEKGSKFVIELPRNRLLELID
ncbi:ATP-binding protein [Planctomycetota bacterium]